MGCPWLALVGDGRLPNVPFSHPDKEPGYFFPCLWNLGCWIRVPGLNVSMNAPMELSLYLRRGIEQERGPKVFPGLSVVWNTVLSRGCILLWGPTSAVALSTPEYFWAHLSWLSPSHLRKGTGRDGREINKSAGGGVG